MLRFERHIKNLTKLLFNIFTQLLNNIVSLQCSRGRSIAMKKI